MRMTASWSGSKRTYRIQVCGAKMRPNGELPSDHYADRRRQTPALRREAHRAVQRPSACSGVKALRNTSDARAASRQAALAFRSLDPFRALREPDRRRRDEERPFPLRTKNSQQNRKQPLDRKSPIQVIMTGQPTFPTLLERFFTQRLMQQRQASAHTIASYRDTFRLLLQFAQKRLRRAPSTLALEDIDAPLVVAFLDELEKVRDVTARTRNLRLSAIHSFFRYVAFEAPGHAAQTQRVLAIPAKRFTRALVPFLSRQEVDALLAAPDQRTWSGRRDHSLILLAVQTGLRLSELTGLQQKDLHMGTGAHVRVIGKGRKERCTPLAFGNKG